MRDSLAQATLRTALLLLVTVGGGCGGGCADAPVADAPVADAPGVGSPGPAVADSGQPGPGADVPPDRGPAPGVDGCPRGSITPADKVLLRAHSADGLTWDRIPGVLVEGGSSPQLVLLGGERTVLFVQDGESLARVPFDGGSSGRIEVEGAEAGWMVDPHLVELPGGGYRLYYVHPGEQVDPGVLPRNPVHSASSDDGAAWRREPGVRIVGELVDPDVVRLADGRWRMYVTQRTAFVYSAVSADGLTFQPEDGVRLQGGGVTSTLPQGDGWRMYLHQPTNPPSKILAASSRDGLAFVPREEPVLRPEPAGADRCGLESPTVLRDDDGWWMVYATVPPVADGGPR